MKDIRWQRRAKEDVSMPEQVSFHLTEGHNLARRHGRIALKLNQEGRIPAWPRTAATAKPVASNLVLPIRKNADFFRQVGWLNR